MGFFQHPHAKQRASNFEKKRFFLFFFVPWSIEKKLSLCACYVTVPALHRIRQFAENSLREMWSGRPELAESWSKRRKQKIGPPSFFRKNIGEEGKNSFFISSSFFRRFCLPWQRKLCEKRKKRALRIAAAIFGGKSGEEILFARLFMGKTKAPARTNNCLPLPPSLHMANYRTSSVRRKITSQ